MSPLETLTKVHWEAMAETPIPGLARGVKWEDLSPFERETRMAAMAKGLLAIKEPGAAVIVAGARMKNAHKAPGVRTTYRAGIPDIWSAMIDALVREG